MRMKEISSLALENMKRGNIAFVQEYHGMNAKTMMKCNKCGYIWSAKPVSMESSSEPCPHCKAEKRKAYIQSKIVTRANELGVIIDNLDLISYQGTMQSKVLRYHCKECGKKGKATVNSISTHLKKHPLCQCQNPLFGSNIARHRLNHDEFCQQIERIHQSKIKVLGQYKNTRIKVKLRCTECGLEWDAFPNNVLILHTGCPHCNKRNNARRKF